MADLALGRRFFRSLTDAELIAWRPTEPRGVFGWCSPEDCQNIGAANREMRRRTKKAGFGTVYEWLASNAPT